MIDARWASTEHTVCKRVALADRDRCEIDPMGHVADRIDVRHVGLRELVDGNAAIHWIERNARFLQSQTLDVGMTPDGEHHLIRRHARSVRQMRGEHIAVAIDLLDLAAGENCNARFFHFVTNMRANILVEATQDILSAIDQRHIGAKSCENAGEFQRDVTAALTDDALGKVLQMKHFIG